MNKINRYSKYNRLNKNKWYNNKINFNNYKII